MTQVILPALLVLTWTLVWWRAGKPRREYRSGTRWGFWLYTHVDSGYITRLHVIKTPWCAVCLHWLNHPDPEPYLHDHPVTFLSIILRGGYTEVRMKEGWYFRRRLTHRWFNWITASTLDRHSIVEVKPRTLTLCLMGPKTREWGFHLPYGEWIGWKDYYKAQRARFAAAKAELEAIAERGAQ